jgi:hypothetical protein
MAKRWSSTEASSRSCEGVELPKLTLLGAGSAEFTRNGHPDVSGTSTAAIDLHDIDRDRLTMAEAITADKIRAARSPGGSRPCGDGALTGCLT